MKTEIYEKIEGYMLQCAGDSAHDAEHIYRVLKSARKIAKTESGVDMDVLITACLLHDIGRPEQFKDPAVCHAQAGAIKAEAFLRELGFDEDFTEKVCHCIRTHRFSNRVTPETIEAKILFDADKLDVVGPLGIARTLQFQGKHDYPLYTRLPDGQIAVAEDSEKSFFQEYHRKLTKLYDGFLTAEGKRLAANYQQDAASFYEALYKQLS